MLCLQSDNPETEQSGDRAIGRTRAHPSLHLGFTAIAPLCGSLQAETRGAAVDRSPGAHNQCATIRIGFLFTRSPDHPIARLLCFFHDLTIEEVDGPVGELRVTRIVSDHADGGAFAVKLTQQIHHRLAILRVQVAGGLVRQ